MKLVIIVPTYNERENIVQLLDELRLVTKDLSKYVIQFLVVDDTSPDGTAQEVKMYQKKHSNVFLLTGKKEGLGRALLRGMTYAADTMKADVLLQLDADLSHDPKSIPAFLKKFESGADFVVGSRYIPGGSIPENWGLHRKIYSIIGNAFVRFGLGMPSVHDWTGGFRAYDRKYVSVVKEKVRGYSGYVFQIAFLYNAIVAGAHVGEVPIHFTDRKFGRSKIAPSEYIRNIITYVLSTRWHRLWTGKFKKFLVVGGIGFAINTLILEFSVLAGFHPSAGSVVGAECAIISNFFLNNAWTFRDRKIETDKKLEKFLQFNMTSVGAILLQAGTIYIGTHLFGVASYRMFYLVGVAMSLLWNYMMYSRVIWKK